MQTQTPIVPEVPKEKPDHEFKNLSMDTSPSPTTATTGTMTASIATTGQQQNGLFCLTPAVTHSLWLADICHKLVAGTAFFLVIRSYFISLTVLQHSLLFSQRLVLLSWYVSNMVARVSLLGIAKTWKVMEPLRKKLEFEFLCFILAAGQPLFCFVLWPGWLVLVGACFAIWSLVG